MFQFFKGLMDARFMPHAGCFFWQPDILWTHVLSDLAIAAAYYSIPAVLIYFVSKRKDLAYPWIFVMFGGFILACGTAHVMAVWTMWNPVYRLEGLVKLVTALISVTTAVMLVPILPKVLALRSPAELEKANRALEIANKKLLEHEKIKSEFFSNISHELRTPLTLILSPLESLLAGEYGNFPHRLKKIVGTMHNNAVRLLQIVQGLLDFQKLEAKKVEVKREPTRIAALTEGIFSDFQALMKLRNIQGRMEGTAGDTVVFIDRYLYERILFNLLSNAVKFTPEGGVISLGLESREGRLLLTVRDSGIGIPAADLPNLFQKFKQIDGSSVRRFEGTGLGLALVKEFAELLDGNVSVKSEPGKGSLFAVECAAPVSEARQDTLVATRPKISLVEQFGLAFSEHERRRELPKKNPHGKFRKVLIAEDNRELAEYLSGLLTGLCITRTAADGEEALDIVQEWMPDLVISDVMMPRRDGLSLCKEIKSGDKTAGILVILLTALSYREALLKGWKVGADDYLFKPFHPKEIVTRVRSALEMLDVREKRREAEEKLGIVNEELRKKLKDLEIMNWAMIGREERMIELKREVNALARELGKKQPYVTP